MDQTEVAEVLRVGKAHGPFAKFTLEPSEGLRASYAPQRDLKNEATDCVQNKGSRLGTFRNEPTKQRG
jgi:hypothetical protein